MKPAVADAARMDSSDSLADAGLRAAADIVAVANWQLMIGWTRRHLTRVTAQK
jgi:hypothetical protein